MKIHLKSILQVFFMKNVSFTRCLPLFLGTTRRGAQKLGIKFAIALLWLKICLKINVIKSIMTFFQFNFH